MAVIDAAKRQRLMEAYDRLAEAMNDVLPDGCAASLASAQRFQESKLHAFAAVQCCGTKPPLTIRPNGKAYDA